MVVFFFCENSFVSFNDLQLTNFIIVLIEKNSFVLKNPIYVNRNNAPPKVYLSTPNKFIEVFSYLNLFRLFNSQTINNFFHDTSL